MDVIEDYANVQNFFQFFQKKFFKIVENTATNKILKGHDQFLATEKKYSCLKTLNANNSKRRFWT